MVVECINVGFLDTNCYIAHDEKSSEGIIIDPGAEGEKILDYISRNNIYLKYIILTHGHWDHIGAVSDIKKVTSARIMIHQLDKNGLTDESVNLAHFIGKYTAQPPADILLKDNDTFDAGNMNFKVIHTPGHTRGGICILVDETLFSGDTLFFDTYGRTDLPGGNAAEMMNSIKVKLMRLDDKIKVYPGHGRTTTIGYERKNYL